MCMHDIEHAWRKGWGRPCNVDSREVTCRGAAASLLFPFWRLVSRSSRLKRHLSKRSTHVVVEGHGASTVRMAEGWGD